MEVVDSEVFNESYQHMQKILRNACNIACVAHNRYFASFEAVNLQHKLTVHWSLNGTLTTHIITWLYTMCEVMFSRMETIYATQDSSGMSTAAFARVMRGGEAEIYTLCDSYIPNKGLDVCASHCQLHLHEVPIKWWMTLWKALQQTLVDVIA